MWALCGSAFSEIELFAKGTHPSDLLAWHAANQGKIRHILCDDGTCGNEGVTPNFYAANDGCVGTDGDTLFDKCVAVFRLSDYCRSWIIDICKDNAWTTKYI